MMDLKSTRRLINIILVFHRSQPISSLYRCAHKAILLYLFSGRARYIYGFRFRNCDLSDTDVFLARRKNQQQQSKHKQVSIIGKKLFITLCRACSFYWSKAAHRHDRSDGKHKHSKRGRPQHRWAEPITYRRRQGECHRYARQEACGYAQRWRLSRLRGTRDKK